MGCIFYACLVTSPLLHLASADTHPYSPFSTCVVVTQAFRWHSIAYEDMKTEGVPFG